MKKVRCIDSQRCQYLTKNAEYDVIEDRSGVYMIIGNDNEIHAYDKWRFEEVNNEQEVEYYEVIKIPPASFTELGTKLTRDSTFFEECIKYPEFFKAHYKQQFKEGDRVTDDNGKNIYTYRTYSCGKHCVKEGNPCISLGRNVRLATAEEIEKASAITIAGYKMEITGTNTFKFGCKIFDTDDLQSIQVLLNSGCKISYNNEDISLDKIMKILNKLK